MSSECFSHGMFETNMLWARDILYLDVNGLDVMSPECFGTRMLCRQNVSGLDHFGWNVLAGMFCRTTFFEHV